MPEHDGAPLGEIHIPYNWAYADAAARTGATGFIAADVGKFARQLDDNSIWMLTATTPTWVRVSSTTEPAGTPFEMVVACSDLTTALAVGAAQNTFPWPRNVTLSSVHAFLVTPQTSGTIFTVDVNENGVSILSTKITIDNGEADSTTATAAPALSETGLAFMAKITVDIDQIGDGTAKGLYLVFTGVRA